MAGRPSITPSSAPDAVCDARGIRPGRDDISIPQLPPGTSWIGEEPAAAERITANGALLVHFFEVGELSSVRSLPFVSGLAGHYRPPALTVLGVHSPRSGLADSEAALRAALDRLDVSFPVANDDRHRIWHAYGCEGWPSSFLWAPGGKLRWVRFGEGAYFETEAVVRELIPPPDLVEPMLEPPSGEPGPELEQPSAEVFPGGSHDTPWTASGSEPLAVEYAGGGAWAALDGEGSVDVVVDDGQSRRIELDGPGVYELAAHDAHGIHELTMGFNGPIRVWSLAFTAGPRG